MVMKIAEAKINATKIVAGGGRKFNLEADNEGLIFAETSLNMTSSSHMSTCIYNSINHDANPGMADAYFNRTFRMFHNTLFNTIREYV